MISALLDRATRVLDDPRIIRDRDGVSKYLSRFYLLGERRGRGHEGMGDEGIADRIPFSPFLHRFHRSDNAGELHSHPWRWGISLILSGGYSEERRQPDDSVTRRVFRPGAINIIRATDYHRVDLLTDECWTLFIAGPKADTWYFWNRETKKRCNWRGFVGLEPEAWEPDERRAA